jgi:hypothetical protein
MNLGIVKKFPFFVHLLKIFFIYLFKFLELANNSSRIAGSYILFSALVLPCA